MMKKTEYLCDRCRKPVSYESLRKSQIEFPYILHRRIHFPANSIIDRAMEGPSIDLCENCQESFKKWLGEEDT